MEERVEHRAAAARPPEATRALQRELAALQERRRLGEQAERRGTVRGLLLLALVVLIASVLRAGVEKVFLPGWWRPW
jgi:ferric-dicitrate binding protein FerR (iron transport regulator)